MPDFKNGGAPAVPYGRLFADMPAGLVLLGKDAEFIDASDYMFRVFGLDRKSALGNRFGNVFRCTSVMDTGQICGEAEICKSCDIQAGLRRILTEGKGFENVLVNRKFLIDGFDTVKWFQINGSAIPVEDGFMALLVFMDVTATHTRLEHLRHILALDQTTGFFNKNSFARMVRSVIREADPEETLTLCMVDLDDFKKLNDSYGHVTGDHAIRAFVRACRNHLRAKDLAGRFGGEEFLFLFRNLPERDVLETLHRIYKEYTQTLLADMNIQVSFSVGLYSFKPRMLTENFDDIIRICDRYLYRAKRRGKNRVVSPGGVYTFPAPAAKKIGNGKF